MFELPSFNIVPHHQTIIVVVVIIIITITITIIITTTTTTIIIIILDYSPLWTLAYNNSSSIPSGLWPKSVNFFFPLIFRSSSTPSDHLFRALSVLHIHPILTVTICFGTLSLFVMVRSGLRLQAGRSRVRFAVGLLGFFIDRILSAALWPWSRFSL